MKPELIKRHVKLTGLRPIMFDRYPGTNNEQLPPRQKLYTDGDGTVIFPEINIMSFLSSINNESAPRRVLPKTSWMKVAKAALSFVMISPNKIPILFQGEKIKADDLRIEIHTHVARMKKGMLVIPNPKERPVVPTPWDMEFDIELYPNPDLTENILRKLFEEGGIQIGFGTYRGLYGKFAVSSWEKL